MYAASHNIDNLIHEVRMYVFIHLHNYVRHGKCTLPAQSVIFIQFPLNRTFPMGQKHPPIQPLLQSSSSSVSHV